MDLTQLANLGEFIGGVAVLVTLVYLALQVRQSNQLEQAESARAIATTQREIQFEFNRMHELAIANPVVLETLCKVEDGQELELMEAKRFHLFANRAMNQWMAAETAHEYGSVDSDYFETIKEDVARACLTWPRLGVEIREMLSYYTHRWDVFSSLYEREDDSNEGRRS